MEEHHIRVQRTARYHTLGDPRSAKAIWIVVHGYGQLARFFLNSFEQVADDRLIVAPEGLSRFYTDPSHQRVGASWMTREDRELEIHDHIAYLDQLCQGIRLALPGATLHVLGFSQGVATVSRWLVHGTTRVSQLVCWGGSLPPDLGTEALASALSQTPVDLVHGSADELVPFSTLKSNQDRLTRAEIKVRSHVFPGGHSLDQVVLSRCMEGKDL